MWIEKNGSENNRVACQDFVGPADAQTLTAPVRLAAADYLRFDAYLETSKTENSPKTDTAPATISTGPSSSGFGDVLGRVANSENATLPIHPGTPNAHVGSMLTTAP
jgi:hypothetical protein